MKPRSHPRWRRLGLASAAAAALAGVLSLYWRPELVFDLAARVWSCV